MPMLGEISDLVAPVGNLQIAVFSFLHSKHNSPIAPIK